MTAHCPRCHGHEFMRATKVVRVTLREGWRAWLFGSAVDEQQIGVNAVCANRECGEVVRIDRDGCRALQLPTPAKAKEPPPEREPRDPIEIDRTPGQQWTRGAR